MINNRRTSWLQRDPYSQRRKLTHRTSWVHRGLYSQRRKLTHRTSWVHRDPYSQRRELAHRKSLARVRHEMKQGSYNFCDWRRDRKARTSCFSCKAWVCKECRSLVCPTLRASHARHGYARSAALWCVPHFVLLMQGMGMQGVPLSGVSHTSCFSCKAWVCKECRSLVCPTLRASHARHGCARSAALWCVPHFVLLMQGMGMQGVQLSGVSRLQGICQQGHRRFTGPAVILLVNGQVKTMKWQLFNVYSIHSVAEPIVLRQFSSMFYLFFVAINIVLMSTCSLPSSLYPDNSGL